MKNWSEKCRTAVVVVLFAIAVLTSIFWRGEQAQDYAQTPEEPSPVARTGMPSPAVFAPQLQSFEVRHESVPRSMGLTAEPAVPEPKFARFAEWAQRYLEAPPEEQMSLETEGIKLAAKRRDEMFDLIQADPERALALTVPFGIRKQLPASVLGLLEERVSGRGTLGVLAALPEKGREGEIAPVYRTAEMDGVIYQAYVYGRRLGEPTREDIRLNGIALDGLLAVDDNPVRILELEEALHYRQAEALAGACALDDEVLAPDAPETWVEAGGEILCLCSGEHAALLNAQLIASETALAPSQPGSSLAASPWTEGIKKLLILRVDFTDLEGEPLEESAAVSLVRNVHAFYQEMSYGKAGFALVGEGSEVTPTFRLDRTAAYYGGQDASRLRSDARSAARAAGYDLTSFNLDVICVGPVPGFRFAGLAYVGAAGAWLRNSFSTGVAAHELGHNFGLQHANFWDTSGQSVVGTGTSVEYGDTFDTMGSAGAGSKHFNARYKNQLNWLPNSDVLTANESGVFRIAACDEPDGAGARALKIAKNTRTNYWVEFRQRYTSNKWLMDGVSLRWAGNGTESTRLLDTTPGSISGKDDSAILPGRTFSDRTAGIHITPLRKLGTQLESLEVVVNLGSFPENRPPLVLLTGETNSPALNTDLVFTASAVDPDGDALAYFWDFGDRNFGGNASEARHRFSSAGEYVVRCVVTDMKGGQASDSLIVRVGSPTSFRMSGRITAEGVPLEGVRVYVSSTQMTYTDSTGQYHLVGLVPGSYSVKASLEGFQFVSAGFLNPVSVGPSKVNVDFIAAALDGQNTKALVAAGSLWRYLDDGSNAGTAWREPGFADRTWSEGPAPLGYGDDNEKTVVGFGSDPTRKHITTYFRHEFTIDNPASWSALMLGLRRDDGGVVYLNGREVFRSNMPAGQISYTTLASSAAGGNNERIFFQTDLDPAWLSPGLNLLAVEIHQSSRSSSDLAFDLELVGTEAMRVIPPMLTWEVTPQALRLTWPDGPTSWVLRSSPDLSSTSGWSLVPVESAGGQRVVTIPPVEQQRFYQLTLP